MEPDVSVTKAEACQFGKIPVVSACLLREKIKYAPYLSRTLEKEHSSATGFEVSAHSRMLFLLTANSGMSRVLAFRTTCRA